MSYSYGRPKPAAATVNRLPAILLFLAVALFIAADLFLSLDFNWVDYVMVIVIALFGLKGYLKGLINTVFSFGGYILGLVLAFVFSPKLALIAMQKTTLGKSIGEKLNELIPTLSSVNAIKLNEAQSVMDVVSKNPDLDKAISENPLIKQLLTVTSTAAETGAMYSETVVTVNDLIVFTVLKVLSLVVLFVAIKLLVVLIGRFLTTMFNSSAILGTANRSGGMAIGLAVGLLICYVVFLLAIPVLGSLSLIKIPDAYSQSVLLAYFNGLLS